MFPDRLGDSSIEFVTLFPGLLTGTHPVTLQMDSQVARVEIVLDGRLVGQLANDLERLLDHQAIVWIDGRHLPGEIEFDPSVKGVDLLR